MPIYFRGNIEPATGITDFCSPLLKLQFWEVLNLITIRLNQQGRFLFELFSVWLNYSIILSGLLNSQIPPLVESSSFKFPLHSYAKQYIPNSYPDLSKKKREKRHTPPPTTVLFYFFSFSKNYKTILAKEHSVQHVFIGTCNISFLHFDVFLTSGKSIY